jgi:asparagine synthase (glutamine-hydrolysing)
MISESPGKRSRLRRVKRLIYPATDSAEQWYMGMMQQFRVESHIEAFTSEFSSAIRAGGGWTDHMAASFECFTDPTTVNAAQWVDTTTYLPDDLLVKTDRMAMAHGLEVRSPLLDQNLLEFASTIPRHYLTNGRSGKQVLKRAYADLIPEEISNRPKAGFTVPIGDWINGPLRGLTHDLLLAPDAEVNNVIRPEYIATLLDQHASRRYNHAGRLWNLVCLETWARSFRVSLTPA